VAKTFESGGLCVKGCPPPEELCGQGFKPFVKGFALCVKSLQLPAKGLQLFLKSLAGCAGSCRLPAIGLSLLLKSLPLLLKSSKLFFTSFAGLAKSLKPGRLPHIVKTTYLNKYL
jgi:hypothetical protein